MERINIMSMQRTYSIKRACVKNDFDNRKQQLHSEYTVKLQKLIHERSTKLLAIDQEEEEMLNRYRQQKRQASEKA